MAARGTARIEQAIGFRDEAPDTSVAETDVMVGVVSFAWADAQVDLSAVPKDEYEEALAYKISAWRWFTEPRAKWRARVTFSECCLALGLDVATTRRAILRNLTPPPTLELPAKWDRILKGGPEYDGSPDYEIRVPDRPYTKRKARKIDRVPSETLLESLVEALNARLSLDEGDDGLPDVLARWSAAAAGSAVGDKR